MNIEGSILMGGLIIVALAIAALLVYIRFAVKKEDPEAESMFSRLLKFGSNDEEEEEGQENEAQSQSQPLDGGLSLPGLSPASDNTYPVPSKKEKKKEKKEKKKSGTSSGGLFSGLPGGKKSKEKIKEEVQAIDEQLNSVLQETTEINVLGLQPEIGAMEMPITEGRGMRELDLEMGALNEPALMPPGDFQMAPPMPEIQDPVTAPAIMAPEAEMPGKTEVKKPDAPQMPAEVEPAKSAMDNFMPETKGSGDDLLDALESDARQEELIDMSIMKEYQDMPITSVELESDLKGILDQITINMHGKERQQV
jgi:hypothetical protein